MTTVEILIAARALITPPDKWTQGEIARDDEGNATSPTAMDAVCWCAQGAIAKVAGGHYLIGAFYARDTLRKVAGNKVFNFNDGHTHAEVLAALDRAIELARAEAAPILMPHDGTGAIE